VGIIVAMLDERRGLGLRAQFALALLGTLAISATLALAAVHPLTAASGRIARRRLGMTLSRAVAGEVSLTLDPTQVQPLLAASVGEGGLSGAALYDKNGVLLSLVGSLQLPVSQHPPPFDDVRVSGEVMAVVVLLPSRGIFVAESSLAPGAAERTVPTAVLLYTGLSGMLALGVVYLALTRWIVRPMEGLTRAAERVAAGRRDVRAEERGAAEVVRAASAFNRMTDQLAARESELSQQVTELEKASAGLRRAQEQVVRGERLAMVGRLAAGIAHEVGNPLAAIVGLSDVMRDGGLEEEEIHDFAGRIGNEAQRIHRTVRQLLDYARAAPGSAAPPRADGAPVEPNAEVRDAIEQVRKLLQPQKAMRDIALSVEVEEGLPTVGVSSDRLVQVVLNLALNAADAIRGDGRSKGEIALRARLDDAKVIIEVEDDGPGIPDALRERIFEPFFTTKPAGEGTGLGLATSAAIVEQAGGSITPLSRSDGREGARMVVTLPAGRPSMMSGGYERG